MTKFFQYIYTKLIIYILNKKYKKAMTDLTQLKASVADLKVTFAAFQAFEASQPNLQTDVNALNADVVAIDTAIKSLIPAPVVAPATPPVA